MAKFLQFADKIFWPILGRWKPTPSLGLQGRQAMRVLYFVGTLELGGLERFVTRVSLEARKTDAFEPIVCCLNKKSGPFLTLLNDANVPVIEAPNNWNRKISRLIDLSLEIKKINPDIFPYIDDKQIKGQRLDKNYQRIIIVVK